MVRSFRERLHSPHLHSSKKESSAKGSHRSSKKESSARSSQKEASQKGSHRKGSSTGSTSAQSSASPLMAAPAAPPSSSRLEKDEERATQRQARDEKKTKEAQKKERAAQAAKRKKAKAREKREQQEAKDAEWDRCEQCQVLLVKAVHVFDSLIGLVFVIYGSLIATMFEAPAVAAVVTTLTYGSALLFASLMGVVGFFSDRCRRIGLAISAYTAPLVACFYLLVLVLEFVSSATDVFWEYLTDNQDVLYLHDGEIQVLQQMAPFFYIVLASLTGIEVCRFLLLRHVRHKLLVFDEATRHLAEKGARGQSSRGRSKSSRGRSAGGGGSGRKGSHSHRSALTESLIDEVAGSESGADY